MKARVKNFTIEVQPMTKFDYLNRIKKIDIQHRENKWIDEFFCN